MRTSLLRHKIYHTIARKQYFKRCDTQHNDTQHKNIQHDDTQHNDTQH
jgi:hypothetical protein